MPLFKNLNEAFQIKCQADANFSLPIGTGFLLGLGLSNECYLAAEIFRQMYQDTQCWKDSSYISL